MKGAEFKELTKTKTSNIWNRAKVNKRKAIIGILIITSLGYYFLKDNVKPAVIVQQTAIVGTGDIVNSIKVVGNTKITDQQTLTFGQQGTVKAIYVKEGQAVKKDTLLAILDKKSLSKNIAQQSLSVQNAKINYNKLLTATSEGDLVSAKNNITSTESKLKVAKQELDNMMLSNGDTLQTKATNIQTVLLSTKSSILESKKILDDINKIFSITVKINGDDIDRLISAKNSTYKQMTQTSYYTVQNKLSTLESSLNMIQAKISTTVTEMESLQEQNKSVLNELVTCLSNAKNAMDSSIVSVDLTQSKIDTRTTTINNANSSSISRLTNLNNEGKSLRTTNTEIQNKRNEIANYESQLKVYNENYKDLANGPSREDRQLQLNNIRSMQISISALSDQGENYEIRAPFDGNIDIIDVKVGDNIAGDNISQKTITVSNPDVYEINMLIDQVDIVKIDKGQPVEILFDSYPGYMVTGSISEIDPTPVTNAGVVSYTAKVIMQKGEKKIYDSMTVTVKIITEKKTNTIIIPNSAIQTENEIKIVNVMIGEGMQVTKIVEGIKDGVNTEILSGLNIGDKILLQKYIPTSKVLKDGNEVKRPTPPNTKGLGIGGSDPGANHGQGE